MHGEEATTVLKRDELGRVTYPRERREALLDEFERSGLKGRPFAQVAGIKYQTFANWVQRRRRARGGYPVTTCPRPAGESLHLVEVVAQVAAVTADAPPALAGMEASALEVWLPGGTRLLVSDARQAELAAQLLHHLQHSATVSRPC